MLVPVTFTAGGLPARADGSCRPRRCQPGLTRNEPRVLTICVNGREDFAATGRCGPAMGRCAFNDIRIPIRMSESNVLRYMSFGFLIIFAVYDFSPASMSTIVSKLCSGDLCVGAYHDVCLGYEYWLGLCVACVCRYNDARAICCVTVAI